MSIAAAYARYSSDAQRDESIEIQLREINQVIEREGWSKGPIYHDHARTGRDGNRPQFQLCVEDGIARKYDILVVYSVDRLARNVSLAQETKSKLFKAGVRIVSVREGEIRDTPEGFLMAGIFDLMADHYSRNLSVKVRGGMWDSAMKCKACGNHHFGYDIDESDHYVINEREAYWVKELYRQYLAGATMNDLRDYLNKNGILTRRNKKWSVQTLSQLLSKPIYKGTYSFMGHVEDGAVPAIVTPETWERVQGMRTTKKNMKRKANVNDYLLTDKVYCLECGQPMCGTAGTSCTGKKYTYYGCVLKDGCGKRVASNVVEDAVMRAVVGVLEDDAVKDHLVKEIASFTHETRVEDVARLDEIKTLESQREKAIDAITNGAPMEPLIERLNRIEDRICELRELVERDRPVMAVPSEDAARAMLEMALADAKSEDPIRQLLASCFIDKVFITKEQALVALRLQKGETQFTVSELWSVVETIKHANSQVNGVVRVKSVWWGTVVTMRTNRGNVPILCIEIK